MSKPLDEKFIRQQVKSVRQQIDGPHGRKLPTRIAVQHMGDEYDKAIAERLREAYARVDINGAGWFYISSGTLP